MAQGLALDLEDYGGTPAATAPARAPAARPSLMTRISTAWRLSRARRQDAEIGAFIRSNGGRLTDNLEREIGRRFGPMGY